MLEFESIALNNGKVLHGKKIGTLVESIIKTLSEADLSHDEAQIVLDRAKRTLGEYCMLTVSSEDNPEST